MTIRRVLYVPIHSDNPSVNSDPSVASRFADPSTGKCTSVTSTGGDGSNIFDWLGLQVVNHWRTGLGIASMR